MKYYLIVGEASGDLHASNLMKALLRRDAQAEFRYFGGDAMAAVGGTLVKHYRELAYMGFLPVLLHARTILKNMDLCRRDVLSWQPDVLILVDYAGFNLKMAAYVSQHAPSIPIHYYISPKIWAWKSHRIKQFRRYVDHLYLIFPFEQDWFAQRHYQADYVGNPSVDSVSAFLAQRPVREEWCRQHGLDAQKPILALLAGSRKQEVNRNLPLMLKVAARYADRFQVVVAGAPGLAPDQYAQHMTDTPFPLVFNQTYALLSVAHTALVVSGTATLETALFDVPQVVCYYLAGGRVLTKLVRRFFIRTPFISLVNLVAGKKVVEELVAYDYTEARLEACLAPLLSDTPQRRQMLQDYARLHQLLGEAGASEHTADLLYRRLTNE